MWGATRRGLFFSFFAFALSLSTALYASSHGSDVPADVSDAAQSSLPGSSLRSGAETSGAVPHRTKRELFFAHISSQELNEVAKDFKEPMEDKGNWVFTMRIPLGVSSWKFLSEEQREKFRKLQCSVFDDFKKICLKYWMICMCELMHSEEAKRLTINDAISYLVKIINTLKQREELSPEVRNIAIVDVLEKACQAVAFTESAVCPVYENGRYRCVGN